MLGKSVLVLIPYPHKLVNVLLVYLVDVIVVRMLILHDPNRTSYNNVDGPSVGHHAHIIVEDTPRMEDGHGKAHELLNEHLELVYVGVRVGVELVVNVVFTKCQDRYEVGAGADGHLDKAFTTVKNEFYGTGTRIEGFTCAAHDDSNCATHAFVVRTSLGENVLAGLAGDGGHAEAQGVFAVNGVAEVGVEGQQGVGNAREELGEAQGLSRKGSESAMGYNAVWVVAKYVLPSRLQLLRAM